MGVVGRVANIQHTALSLNSDLYVLVFLCLVYCLEDVSTMMMAGRYALMIALSISLVPSECKPAALHRGNRGHQKHVS